MKRAARLAGLLTALALPASAEGLKQLDAALVLHPFTREALFTLETFNTRYLPNAGARVEPEAVLGAFEEMLRRNFRSVTRVAGMDEAAAGRFHLIYQLDLSLEIGLKSGDKTEVHVMGHILRPDGAKVDFVNVTATRTVPNPATRNMLLEAVLEARDRTETALRASPQLAAFANGSPAV